MRNGEMDRASQATSCFAAAIGRVTSILAIPYGYTVTLGAAALLAVARMGAPSEVEVLFFALGAVLGFVLPATIGCRHLATEIPMRVPWLVVFNFFPIAAALAVIALPTHLVGKGSSYFACGFVATMVYVCCLAVFVRVRDRLRIGTRE